MPFRIVPVNWTQTERYNPTPPTPPRSPLWEYGLTCGTRNSKQWVAGMAVANGGRYSMIQTV